MALSPNFNQVEVDLLGVPLNNPTSLQFGPDGRLYVSQQDGLIRSFSLKAITDTDGNVTKIVLNDEGGADQNDLVKNIPNHDDNGDLNTALGNRQVTGLVVEAGPNGETVLYVSSSDPRIGGGSSGADKNLDTNSGIISRLVKTGDTWEKVDLVIGLPRSEENHSTNGLDIRTEMVNGELHKIMYVASGGNTNRGAPSNNFAWSPEYYYSAAILRIDLTQLEQIEAAEGLKGGTDYVDPYVYALPTLNDPTRSDNTQGQDTAAGTTGSADAEAADTFGGNNGRNQAKYDPDGPVQIYSMGYRNSYDLVITENNNIYTFDNGPNNGWGDIPLEADGSTPITSSSQVATNYPNINVDTGSDTAPDNLHLVTTGFYAGHPNSIYASGPAAGLYWVDTSSGSPVVTPLTDPSDPNNDPTTTADDLPSDWNEIAGGITHPEAGVYISPGSNPDGMNKEPDGSLVTLGSSSNGLAEYIAGKAAGSYPVTDVSGAEVLATVAFNGNVYFMELVGDGTQEGTQLTDISPIFIGGTPLDLTIGTGEFQNAIFITQFGSDALTALVPGIAAAVDPDQDDDGLDDAIDPFQYDSGNGTTIVLNGGETLFWDFNPADSGQNPGKGTEAEGPYNIGMTGWMINGVDDLYLDPEDSNDDSLTDLDNTIRGGAPGIVQIKSVTEGDSQGSSNTQRDALQTGFLPANNVQDFTIKVPIYNPFTSDANNGVIFDESASMGVALGDGSQSNFIKVVVGVKPGGNVRAQVVYEENDAVVADLEVPANFLLNGSDDEVIELQLKVDMVTFQAVASWSYLNNGTPGSSEIGTVQLDPNGKVAEVLKGDHLNNGQQSAAAVTLVATSAGAADPFTADFLDLTVESTAKPSTDLELVKTVSNPNPAVGETVTFDLTVSNTSSTDTTVVTVADLLPAGFTYSSHSGGTYDPSTGIWDVGSVANGGSKMLSIAAVVNDPATVGAPETLYRINAGGGTIASADSSKPDWAADTGASSSPYLTAGGNSTFSTTKPIDLSDPSLPNDTPASIFQTERWDPSTAPEMSWAFPLLSSNEEVEVRLYFAEIYSGITGAGQRVFDVAVEGSVVSAFDNIDPFGIAGANKAFMLSHTLTVADGELNLEFLHGIENPAIKGIEIIDLTGGSGGNAADYTNYAQILTLDQTDIDSIAGDDSITEDDDASAAVTVLTGTQDTIPPVVDIAIAEAILTETAEAQVISVTYSDDGSGLDIKTLDASDITVTGSSTGTVLAVNPNPTIINNLDGTYTVEYTVSPPGETWDSPDNDTYNIALNGAEVFDLAGNAAAANTSLNSFVVSVDEAAGTSTVLYRINAGGSALASIDSSTVDWTADTSSSPSAYLVLDGGGNKTFKTSSAIDTSLVNGVPTALFQTERWDPSTAPEMSWAFPLLSSNEEVEVRLYFAEIYSGITGAGQRVFDVAVEGSVVSAFDNIDPFGIAGANKAFMLSHTLTVADGELNLEFLHGIENPAIKGIEILAVGDETANTPPITSGIPDVMVTEGAANTVIGLFAAFEDAETADSGLTYTVASNTNPALFDTVSINNSTGELTLDYAPTGTGTAEITVRAADPDREFVDAPFTVTVDDNAVVGKATLEVTVNSNNVQISNFGSNSFLINNPGNKDIAQVIIDVTDAFYPDTVFDPFGLAGDTVSKALTINTDGGTGVVTPDSSSYIGVGGAAGFEGIQLLFDESVNGGFNPGETIGFSVDMDPNSVAGTNKADLDGGSSPSWDVGGVSGAELIGSTFTVTFTDGTTATGQLQGANNQGGSKGLASQDSPNQAVSLTVNGLGEGGIGTYNSGGPSVIINGPAGQTARVVLTKGFIQPVDPYAQFLEDQLNTLAATNFPANNAVEFQTVDVVLTGGDQDISGNFDFSGVANYNFSADPALPFSLDEDKLPFGFVASVIDPANNNLPIGPVTQPIYLEFAAADGGSNTPPIAVDDSVSTDENSVFTGNVLVDNGNGTDSDLDGDPLTITAVNGNAGNVGIEIALASGALLTLNGNGTFSYNPNDQFEALTAGETAAESFTYTIGDGNDGFDTATATVTITGVDETPGGTPIRIEAESADTIVNYRNENIGVASGGLVLSFVGASGGETGSATFVFGDDLDELTGSYDIVVGTFDENDGLASFTVEINDVETSTTTEIGSFILDNDLGSNLANSQTFVSPTVAFGISLTAGDAITVKGFENASEHARFDYVELVPTV